MALIENVAFQILHDEEDTKGKRRSRFGGTVVGVGGGEAKA